MKTKWNEIKFNVIDENEWRLREVEVFMDDDSWKRIAVISDEMIFFWVTDEFSWLVLILML